MAKEPRALGWEYLMFFLFIALTVCTPLWKRIFGKKKQRSKADYVFATGGISIIAIMISIARGTLGVRTVLGYPSELFYYGSGMWEIIYGMMIAYPIVCYVFVPVYFNLGITSVYQYLDMRFKSRLIRSLASATYAFRQVCSLGIAVYTPSVALFTVIGIPVWASIVGITAICIFCTILGGLKAAINADVIQSITVIVVSLAVIIKGSITSGGVKRVLEINQDNDRIQFLQFTGDFTRKIDTTSAILGQLFISLSQFGCQQNFMQRYISLKSIKSVKKAMLSNIPLIFIFFSLSWLCGLVIYSTYVDCDPLASGRIQKSDEILPFYVKDQMSFLPGFLGIFMAVLFNGALCMMVSNLNSLATVIWEDFMTLLTPFKGLGDKQQLFLIKVITVVFGIIIMGIAFMVSVMSGIIDSTMVIFSASSGPLLGCFILAMLVPIANWKGTSAGMLTAFSVILWIIFGGATLEKKPYNQLPTSTEGCERLNLSESIGKPSADYFSWQPAVTVADFSQFNHSLLDAVASSTVTPGATSERTALESFYSISYMYYSPIGTLLTVAVGVIISYFTRTDSDIYDAKLLHPMILKFSQRFAGSKPYYIKQPALSASNAAGPEVLCFGSKAVSIEKCAKINHGFEPPNESNIIIGNSAAAHSDSQQKHSKLNPMESAVFTTQSFNQAHNIAGNGHVEAEGPQPQQRQQQHAAAENLSLSSMTQHSINDNINSGTYRQLSDEQSNHKVAQ